MQTCVWVRERERERERDSINRVHRIHMYRIHIHRIYMHIYTLK